MNEWGPERYGDQAARVYDRTIVGFASDAEATADRLAALAADGPALELGIGTGRVALPLVARGVDVHGIDASEEMVSVLRSKPGGAAVPITVADFVGVPVERRYPLVFVVFNTFFNLLTAEDQQRCFNAVEAALEPAGRFVMEVFVPDLSRFDRGQRVGVRRIEVDEVELEVSLVDVDAQRVTSSLVTLREDGVRLLPVRLRYAWPAELDTMAAGAGLELEHRWAGWHEEPFTATSMSHVSVWRRPA